MRRVSVRFDHVHCSHNNMKHYTYLSFLVPVLAIFSNAVLGMTEEERLEQYAARGYEWPLEKLVPDTEGWKKLYRRRFEQLSRIEDKGERYDGWIQVMSSALVAPNFTENG